MNATRTKKIILASAIATIALFAWGGFSHMVLLEGVGFSSLPNEELVLSSMRDNISKQGLYFFPGKSFGSNSEQDQAMWLRKFATGPVGMLIYRPAGGNPFSPAKLVIQLLSNLVSVVIAVFLVSLISAGYWRRVIAVTTLGLLACSAVSTIYWNWYEFPTSFFGAQLIDMVVGFFIVGLILSRLVPYGTSANRLTVPVHHGN